MTVVINGTTGIDTVQDGSITASDLASTLDLTGKTVTLPAGTGGKVLQVVSTTKTDTTSTTSSSYNDISGMSVSITPSSSSNKVLVTVAMQATGRAGNTGFITKLLRNSTDICVGNSSGSRIPATANIINSDNSNMVSIVMTFLDSPATTSSTTYKLQWMCFNGSTVYLNRSYNDDDAFYIARTASTITAMEIAA